MSLRSILRVPISGAKWLMWAPVRGLTWLGSVSKATAVRAVLGAPGTHTTRIGTLVMVVCAAVVAAGAYGAVISGLEPTGDSSWVMGYVVTAATSLWTYVAVALLAVFSLLAFKDSRAASLAADKTGFSKDTVQRLAAEAKTTDGCATIVVSPDDRLHEIVNQILRVFDTPAIDPGDDRLSDFEERIVGSEFADDVDETADETALVPAEGGPSWVDGARLTRLELASSLSFNELAWRFLIPALAVFVGLLILVEIWVSVWVYPLLAATAVLAGAAYYQLTRYRRRRQLTSLRTDDTSVQWSDIAVMVKRVETPDTTAYYAWVAGECYVDYNAFRLAITVARAAFAHVHDEPVPPAIQRKFARNVRQHVPNLRGYEENIEKPDIMDDIADVVASMDGEIIPKNQLADRVIQRDTQGVNGYGYDPRLVAECYEKLVPYALTEVPVEVATPTDEATEMTAVRLRTSELPHEKATAEAEFSTAFDPDAESEYRLPEVEHTHDMVI